MTAVAQTPCPFCGVEGDPAARFCASCGRSLVEPCPACGAETRVGAKFCSVCGHRLDAPVRREEERKLVTVLFADVTGSTKLGEQLDPERLRALLGQYFGAMASVIEFWGGKVEKFIGDAVMAVFGIPSMHEDDPERALHAALEMQARLVELNPELRERHGVQLEIRIGINTGEVAAGADGDQLMVSGDAVNVAARLQGAAEPGQVVLGERTYLAARGAFVLEPLPERALRGKSLPVPSWRLVRAADDVRRRGWSGTSTRIVGRARELDLLASLYRATVDDARPRLLTILGEAGIGKTRLVEEFLGRTASGGTAAVYTGRCLPYGQGITYWALREILWEAAGIVLGEPASVAAEKLERLCSDLLGGSGNGGSEARRVLFALATTAGITVPDNPLDLMSPESIGEELGLAWPRLVSALAARAPTVVVIEDLHRAEAPLLDMIEHLVARSSGSVLFLVTARPDFAEMRAGWNSRPGVSQVFLDPLGDGEVEQLLAQLLAGSPGELRERVAASAEGNPFFAEEIVGHLLDQGILAREPQGLVEASRGAALTIPDSVRALLAARVDALRAEEKRTLQDAAVVGRAFWRTTLEAMGGGASVDASLRGLERRGLIVARPTSSLPGQGEFAFRHGLTREVAYRSIPKGRRARAHAEVASWIAELVGDRRAEYVELLAHHYEAAARSEDAALSWPADPGARDEIRAMALAALLDAGRAARARFAIDEALGFGERALALAKDDAERLSCLELRADAAHAAVRADEAWSCYLQALETAESIGDAAAVARLRANAALLWARYGGAFSDRSWRPAARELIERGLDDVGAEARTFEAAALLIGRSALGRLGIAESSDAALRSDAERAVEIAEAIGSPHLLSHALDEVAWALRAEGFCGSARMAERTQDAAGAMTDRVEAHELLVTAALGFADAGQFDRGAELARRAAREARQLAPHHRLHAASAQTACLLPAGELERLREATSEVVELVLAEGSHTCAHGAHALIGRAVGLFEATDPPAAASALELFDEAVPTTGVVLGHAYPAELLRPFVGLREASDRADRADPAEVIVDRVRELRSELQLRALAGEWAAVERLGAEARGLASQACAPYLLAIAGWTDAVRLAASGRSLEAVSRARETTGTLLEYGERYRAARLLVDLIPFLDPELRPPLAGEAAAGLERMGAVASASEARSYVS